MKPTTSCLACGHAVTSAWALSGICPLCGADHREVLLRPIDPLPSAGRGPFEDLPVVQASPPVPFGYVTRAHA